MLVIDNDDLNILNLYIATKNYGLPTKLFENNIKTLKIEGLSEKEMIEAGRNEGCRATFCPGKNTFYYNKDHEVLSRTKNHEFLHCASTRTERLKSSKLDKYKNFEYIPFSGISSFLPGGISFGKSLNEGLTEFIRADLLPDFNEEYGYDLHPAYFEMITAICLIMSVIGFDETYNFYFDNNCKNFYELMEKHFGKNWHKIIIDCDTSFDYQVKMNQNTNFLIRDLIMLKYQLEIINYAYKNSADRVIDNEIFEEYFDVVYPEESFNKKVIDHRIKKLKKKYKKDNKEQTS